MTKTAANPFPHSLMVDTDPEDESCFSVWCDNGQGSSAEIAGRICDKMYAGYIVRAVNSHAALVEALEATMNSIKAMDENFDVRDSYVNAEMVLTLAKGA